MYDDKPELNKDEWISALKLSTKWRFNDLRKLAISHLSSITMDATERICLAKAFRVYDWLLEGYGQVVERLVSNSLSNRLRGTLTAQEGRKIGLEVALELSGIAIRQLRRNDSSLSSGGLESKVLEVFKEEFECVRRDERRLMTRADGMKEKDRQEAEAEAEDKNPEENAKEPHTGKKQRLKDNGKSGKGDLENDQKDEKKHAEEVEANAKPL